MLLSREIWTVTVVSMATQGEWSEQCQCNPPLRGEGIILEYHLQDGGGKSECPQTKVTSICTKGVCIVCVWTSYRYITVRSALHVWDHVYFLEQMCPEAEPYAHIHSHIHKYSLPSGCVWSARPAGPHTAGPKIASHFPHLFARWSVGVCVLTYHVQNNCVTCYCHVTSL